MVAGASGFLPAHLAHTLLKCNELFHQSTHAIAMCCNEKKACQRFGKYLARDDFAFLMAAVYDPIHAPALTLTMAPCLRAL